MGAREALRYPPHVTLRTGINCPDDLADDVGKRFLEHASKVNTLPIETGPLFSTIYGHGALERGLLAWPVTPTPELWDLHRHLLEFSEWQKGPQAVYQPHVSVVFGDIGARQLRSLAAHLQSHPVEAPQPAWQIDHVALFTETRDRWVEWGRADLVGPERSSFDRSRPSRE